MIFPSLPFFFCCSTIDLTDEPHTKNDSDDEISSKSSGGGQVCPMCGKTFSKAEIQLHADKCINAKSSDAGNHLTKCHICCKKFETSLISIHMEQCSGDSSDGSTTVTRKSATAKNIKSVCSGNQVKKAPHQLTLRDLRHRTSQDIENDSESGR